ncbi:hypothetical protein ARMGADRAFT_1038426 [Armillaria gallica]|uniref:Uncharacterized protein n=1 Tax=Armillaria gallica TaxID=47427 RepID=A0A2H3D2T5_ARMGA|nr:hypothetical protein ARMGADRAFT_1038426 [Armillaria gallica]
MPVNVTELSTENSLSIDSLEDSLSLRLIIIDSDDEEPLMSPKASWNPGRKGRPVGSKPVSHKNPMHAASLPTGPDTPVSREQACHGDGFYVVMNGHIMEVFNSWYGKEMNLTEGSYSGFPHQSYCKFPSLRDALVTWDETWSNQEIRYPADRCSNQSQYGPEWFYWVVVKGHVSGLYNTFDEAVLGAGDEMHEVVVTWDEDIASHLLMILPVQKISPTHGTDGSLVMKYSNKLSMQNKTLLFVLQSTLFKCCLEYSSFLMQTDPFKR